MKMTGLIMCALLLATGCGSKPEDSDQRVDLDDAALRDLVQRSFQYVAMYNVNNKFAETRGGWNSVLANTELADHTLQKLVGGFARLDGRGIRGNSELLQVAWRATKQLHWLACSQLHGPPHADNVYGHAVDLPD